MALFICGHSVVVFILVVVEKDIAFQPFLSFGWKYKNLFLVGMYCDMTPKSNNKQAIFSLQ